MTVLTKTSYFLPKEYDMNNRNRTLSSEITCKHVVNFETLSLLVVMLLSFGAGANPAQ